MEELIKAMSNEDLEAMKAKHADEPSILTLLDGILETRVKEADEAKAKAKFTAGIAKLFSNLPHPEDVLNVSARWAEVELPIPDSEGEEVEIVDKDGNKSTEFRQPTFKEYQWVVEVNKPIRVTSGGDGSPKASKRAITVFKRNGTTLEPKGNFASASKACEALGLTIGGDSATRVLAREAYIVEPYDGTDFNAS